MATTTYESVFSDANPTQTTGCIGKTPAPSTQLEELGTRCHEQTARIFNLKHTIEGITDRVFGEQPETSSTKSEEGHPPGTIYQVSHAIDCISQAIDELSSAVARLNEANL